MRSSDFHIQAKAIADLVVSKQAAYGDSFGKSGAVMKALYPNGVPSDKMDDALTIIRIIDKMFRIATKKDAFGENPFKDILGYALLAVVREERNKMGTTCKGRRKDSTVKTKQDRMFQGMNRRLNRAQRRAK